MKFQFKTQSNRVLSARLTLLNMLVKPGRDQLEFCHARRSCRSRGITLGSEYLAHLTKKADRFKSLEMCTKGLDAVLTQ